MRFEARATASALDSRRFHVSDDEFVEAAASHYPSLYFNRRSALSSSAIATARKKHADLTCIDIAYAPMGATVLVVGTLYRCMGSRLEQRALGELGDDDCYDLANRDRCADTFKLDDATGRLGLMAQERGLLDNLPSGAVIAVVGHTRPRGDTDHRHDTKILQVVDVALPGLWDPPLIHRRPPSPFDDRWVALVSGLRFGSPGSTATLSRLTRLLRPRDDVCRLIIAGNTLGGDDGENDCMLESLCRLLPVDLLPGADDPACTMLPQQPLLGTMFPKSRATLSLYLRTNPTQIGLDAASASGGLQIVGSSGQPLDDMMLHGGDSAGQSRLDALELSVRLRHLAPTAPETLPCSPSLRRDPFVLPSDVDLLFAGNQPCVGSGWASDGNGGPRTRLVLVPDCKVLPMCVFVHLRTLECVATPLSERASTATPLGDCSVTGEESVESA